MRRLMVTDVDYPARASAFRTGLALFNQGHFFAAHEAWEGAWREAQGTERLLLQGLIQAAAALLHVERGNLRGARSVYAKASARLDPMPSRLMGLELESFRIALRGFFVEALAGRAPRALPLLREVERNR